MDPGEVVGLSFLCEVTHTHSHPLAATSEIVFGIFEHDYWPTNGKKTQSVRFFIARVKDFVQDLRRMHDRTNIRTVYLALFNEWEDVELSELSSPRTRHAVFGMEEFKIADSGDEKGVELASSVLYRYRDSTQFGSRLVKAHAYIQGAPEIPERGGDIPWGYARQEIEREWLIDCYDRDHHLDSSAIRLEPGQTIAEENTWIKASLAEMPESRPVYTTGSGFATHPWAEAKLPQMRPVQLRRRRDEKTVHTSCHGNGRGVDAHPARKAYGEAGQRIAASRWRAGALLELSRALTM